MTLSFPLLAQEKATRDNPVVTVKFVEPATYTDFKTSRLESKSDREALMAEFRDNIQRVAGRYVSKGHHLELRFHDIDMAGDFEPSANPNLQDVRIVRAIYPPSIVVGYTLKDSDGNIVASGKRRETDLAFQLIVSYRTDRRLFYETELVIDLLREITRIS